MRDKIGDLAGRELAVPGSEQLNFVNLSSSSTRGRILPGPSETVLCDTCGPNPCAPLLLVDDNVESALDTHLSSNFICYALESQ